MQRLFIDFLMDPTGELDTSCVEDTVPLDFEGDQFGEYFFGTPDYWENPEEGSTRTPPASLPASLKHVEAELARLLRTTCPELERLAVPR